MPFVAMALFISIVYRTRAASPTSTIMTMYDNISVLGMEPKGGHADAIKATIATGGDSRLRCLGHFLIIFRKLSKRSSPVQA